MAQPGWTGGVVEEGGIFGGILRRMSLNRSLRSFIYVVLGICAGQIAIAQQYPIIPVPGAPTNLKVLSQDSTGRLWVGGDELATFDGTRFFFMKDFGMPAGTIQSIAEDSSGAIWIGSETGVYRFASGRVEEMAKGFGVSVIAATPEVVLAAMGPAGAGVPLSTSLVRIRRDGPKWSTETIQSLESPGPLTLDHQGMLLFPGPVSGWSEIRLDEAAKWRPGTRLASQRHPYDDTAPDAGPRRVMRDRFGCVWYGAEGTVAYTCPGGTWQTVPLEAGLNSFEERDGEMLLTGHNIIATGRPNSFRIATQENGLPALLSAIQADDGTIWLGGPQGLFRFAAPFRMEYWTTRDGVNSPWAIQRSGPDIFAAMDRSIGRLNKDRTHWDKLDLYSASGPVMNLLPVGDDLLAALNPGGLALLRRDGKILARTDPAPGFYGLRLAETDPQDIWMGGLILAHLTRAGSRLIVKHHQLETQPAGNVLDVQYEPNTRKLWACYVGGLAVRNADNTWREITVKDGLSTNACWSLAALPNGDVWYGYYSTPAFARIRPKADGHYEVRQFRASDGVRDPESVNFDVDRRGWLWRGGNHGLSVSDPANAEAGRWLFFDRAAGLSGEGINTGSFLADRDGSVWMGIDLSIFHFTPPADLLTPQFAPDVFLSSFSTGSDSFKMAGTNVEFPRGSNVVAHLGSLQFDRRSALRFRYRMEGERNWKESGSLDLPLGKLSAGSHGVEAQARLFTGPWSSSVRGRFTVLRPLWITWPFLLGYVTCAALSLSGAYWLRWKRQVDASTLLPDLTPWRRGALVPEVQDVTGELLDGRFEASTLLARGGFANVMEGYDHVERRRCALKVFRNEIRDKSWVLRTFQQEVAALEKVRHRNVVSIYAHGISQSGAPYLAMEFVEGRNLREILEQGAISPLRAGRALGQLASALDAIHALGICHRDVKPENIILRHEGPSEELVLIDFSIAIVKDADETLYGLSRAAGTFDYMGPEQAVGYAEPSSDVYSLAKVVIEMLTGKRLKMLLPDAALDLPDRVRELAGRLPVRFSESSIEMLAAALEFDPSRRPRVASQFAAPLILDLRSNS